MTLGARDLSTLGMLTGWDATALKNFDIENKTDFTSVVGMVNSGLGALNAELRNDPIWSSLISYTDQPSVEYRVGGSNGVEEFTEYGKGDAKRAATEGHMLPLKAYDRRLAWTWAYLKKARMSQIEADIADGFKDWRDKFRVLILTRCLKRGDDSGTTYGLGSGGYSPGFATTAGSTSVDFTPPTVGGTSFASTHEHYVATASSGAFTLAVFQDKKAELAEHGHAGPYEALIGPTEEAAIRLLTGFTPTAQMNVRLGATQDVATISNAMDANGGYYIGMLEDFAIRVLRGMPQYYGFFYKSYGQNSQMNPLGVRLEKGFNQPNIIMMVDPNSTGNANHPLQNLMFYWEVGVGVKDRTAGTAHYNNNGTWADGTPT